MAKTKAPYPAQFRQQIVELALAGRSSAELSREFGPTTQRKATAWFAGRNEKMSTPSTSS